MSEKTPKGAGDAQKEQDIEIPTQEGQEVSDSPDEPTSSVRRPTSRGFFRRSPRRAPTSATRDTSDTHPTAAIPVVEEGPATPDDGHTPAPQPSAPEAAPGASELRRRRAELIDQREELLFHVGGLVYDLYQRDMLNLPAARQRCGLVYTVDEEIREIDRLLAGIEASRRRQGTVTVVEGPEEIGACLACRAPFFVGARFCMQCGTHLLGPVPSHSVAASESRPGDTRVIAPSPSEGR